MLHGDMFAEQVMAMQMQLDKLASFHLAMKEKLTRKARDLSLGILNEQMPRARSWRLSASGKRCFLLCLIFYFCFDELIGGSTQDLLYFTSWSEQKHRRMIKNLLKVFCQTGQAKNLPESIIRIKRT